MVASVIYFWLVWMSQIMNRPLGSQYTRFISKSNVLLNRIATPALAPVQQLKKDLYPDSADHIVDVLSQQWTSCRK